MKNSRSGVARIGFVVSMGLSVSAWADEGPAPSAPPTAAAVEAKDAQNAQDAKARADALYDEGLKAAEAQEWAKAAQKFAESYNLDPAMLTIAQLGKALVKDKQYVQGATKLQQFLREAKGAPEAARKTVEELLHEAERYVATVNVTIEPAGAVVTVDGRQIEADELSGPIYVEPGERKFAAQKAGFVMAPVTKTCAAGQGTTVTLVMGVDSGEGGEPMGSPKTLESSGMALPVKIGFGLAGGLAVAAGVLALTSSYYESRAIERAKTNDGCSTHDVCESQYGGPNSTFQSTGRAAVVLVGAAGVLSVASLGYYALAPKRTRVEAKRPAGVSFVVGPYQQAGITVIGSW